MSKITKNREKFSENILLPYHSSDLESKMKKETFSNEYFVKLKRKIPYFVAEFVILGKTKNI